MLWRMDKVMYGRRKGPQSWSNYLAAGLRALAVERSRSAPHLFANWKTKVFLEAHLHLAGPKAQLVKLV